MSTALLGTVSNLLKEKREEILSLWTERALSEVPSASTAATLVLRNSLPTYLDHLAEALATNRRLDLTSVLLHDRRATQIGKIHGADRASTPSYVLTEVIKEYSLLRQVIFEVLEEQRPLISRHRDIIYDSIEQAVNDAAVKFSEVHADIQQKFVNTLTHDLKMPLTSAKMSAQMILKRSDRPDDCIRSSARIIGNLNRLDSMIHDLLDASRLRAGEPLLLQFVHCDLTTIIKDVAVEMSDIQDVPIVVEVSGTCEGRWGSDGLRRALENLIGNAIKYGEPGAPVKVILESTESGVRIEVHNQGIPIPAAEIPLLFQQYRRSKSAEQSSKTGWGIGLSLVKGVVDAHHGSVRVESGEGRGTSFILELTDRARREEGSNLGRFAKVLQTRSPDGRHPSLPR